MGTITLITHAGLEDPNPKVNSYDSSFTGMQYMQLACFSLGVAYNEFLIAKYLNSEGQEMDLDMNQTLEQQGIINETHLYIFDNSYSSDYYSQGQQYDQYTSQGQQYYNNQQFDSVDYQSFQTFNANSPTNDLAQNNAILQPTYDAMAMPSFPAPDLGLPPLSQISTFGELPPLGGGFMPPIEGLPDFNSFNIPVLPDFDLPTFEGFDSGTNFNSSADMDISIKDNDTFDNTEFESRVMNLGKNDEMIQIYTFNGFNFTTTSPLIYSKKASFQDVLTIALRSLNLMNDDYQILLIFSDDEMLWFEKEKFLEDYSVYSGMKLAVFREQHTITITSPHFDEINIEVGIRETVRELVEKIAKSESVDNFIGFTLYKSVIKQKKDKKRTTWEPLQLDLDLPHQTQDYKKLKFQRRFLIFSAEDMFTLDSALIAFNDARNEMHSGRNIYIFDSDVVPLAAYGYIAECEGEVDVDKVPKDCSKWLPKGLPRAKKLGKYVAEFIETLKKNSAEKKPKRRESDANKDKGVQEKETMPDRINAINRYLRLARMTPGFGCTLYSANYAEGGDTTPLKIVLTPYTFVLTEERKGREVFHIRYGSMIDVSVENDVISITYQSSRQLVTFTATSKHADQVAYIILEYQRIQRDILIERARLRREGLWNGPTSLLDTLHLTTIMGVKTEEGEVFEYDRSFNGEFLVQMALKNLGKEDKPSDNYMPLIIMHKMRRYIDPDITCAQVNVYDGCVLHLIKKKANINVILSDGETKKMLLPITDKSSDIVKEIFKQIGQNFVHGYSLFIQEKDKMYPIDGRFSPPEQTNDYKTLYFKRRFYLLTRNDLATEALRNLAYNDCRNYIIKESHDLTEQTATELAIISLLIEGKDEEFISTKEFKIDSYFPKSMKLPMGFKARFIKAFKEYPRIKSDNAIKHYIKIARDTPYFGAERYEVKYRNVPDQNTEKKKRGPLVHAFIEFCPLWIYIKDDKDKVLTKIHWRNVINTRTKRSNCFLFTFVKEGQSHTTKYEIITKDMSKIMMLMNQMINIFQILIAEQQRLEKRIREEMQLRIEGGWVDENGVVHNAMIDLFCASDLTQERIKKLKWFDLDSKYEDVKAYLMEEFKLQPEVKQRNTYGLMIRSPDGEIKWLKEEQRLADIKPLRKSAIYIFNITPIVKVKSPQGIYKTIIIDISHPLRKLLKYIANKFNTTTCLGYTLFTEKGNPLDIQRTIPEQTVSYNSLSFGRRFYVISKSDFATTGAFWQTYADVVQHVHKGTMEIPFDQLCCLVFYELKAEIPGFNASLIPSDLSKYIPANYNHNTKNLAKEIKYLLEEEPVPIGSDPLEISNLSKRQYIATARSNPTFGCEKYQCLMWENTRGRRTKRPMTFMITPYRLIVYDPVAKKDWLTIFYEQIISLEDLQNTIAIIYCDMNLNQKVLVIETDYATTIKAVIKSYTAIKEKILRRSTKHETIDPENIPTEYKVTVKCQFMDEHPRPVTLDLHFNGKQVTERCCQILGVNTPENYACLVVFTEQDSIWAHHDKFFYQCHPFEGVLVKMMQRYSKINVSFAENKPVYCSIDLTDTVIETCNLLAKRFNIRQPIGYTLYKDDGSGELKPLELETSIPQQTSLNGLFILRRRFFMRTKEDINISYLVPEYLEEFRLQVLSGTLTIQPGDVVTLTYYDLYAHAENKDDIKDMELTDITPYMPKGMTGESRILKNVNTQLKKRKAISKINAAKKYIQYARQINGFAQMKFPAEYNCHIKGKISNYEVDFIISSTVFEIRHKAATLHSYPYRNIIAVKCIEDQLRITVQDETGESTIFALRSDDSYQIMKLLNTMRLTILPLITKRGELQKKGILEIPTEGQPDEIPIVVHTSLSDMDGVRIFLNPSHSQSEVIDYLKKIFFLDTTQLQLFRFVDDGSVITIKEDEMIYNLGVFPECHMFFMPIDIEVFIESSKIFISKHQIDITKSVQTLCYQICSALQLGSDDGYTLYTYQNGSLMPRDLYIPLCYQTDWIYDMVLKRRFYIFNYNFADDANGISALFYETKQCVANGSIKVTENQAIDLLVTSIYATISNITEFLAAAGRVSLEDNLPKKMRPISKYVNQYSVACRSIPPLQAVAASEKYIAECCTLRGFGCENYEITFTNLSDPSMKMNKPGLLVLSPYKISIEKPDGSRSYQDIMYNKIINFQLMDNMIFEVKFYNDSESISIFQINIGNDGIYVLSYLNTVMYFIDSYGMFLSPQEFKDMILRRHHNDGGEELSESDPVVFVNGMINFDEWNDYTANDINIDNLIANSDYTTTGNFDNEFNTQIKRIAKFDLNEALPPNLISQLTREDFAWRNTEEGLSMTRSMRVLENSMDEVGLLRNAVETRDIDTFNDQVNIMSDTVAFINFDEMPEDILKQYREMNHSLGDMREMGKMIKSSNQDMYMYFDPLTEYLDNIQNALTPINSRVKEIIAQKVAANKAEITPVSKSLIIISDLQEALSMSLSKKMDKLKIIGIDGHALVASLQNCSHAITSLASMITENTDPLVVDQHVIPRLREVHALMDEIDKAVQKATIAQIDLGDVTTYSKSLREANDTIQKCFVKFSNDNKEIIGAHNITLKINQNAINAANIGLIRAFRQIDKLGQMGATTSNFQDLVEEINNLTVYLAMRAQKGLKSTEDICKIQLSLNRIKEYSNKIAEVKSSNLSEGLKILDGEIYAIEQALMNVNTVFVTPSNINYVVNDLNLFVKRAEDIDVKTWKTTDPATFEEYNKIINTAKDDLKSMNDAIGILAHNIVDGKSVQRAQRIVIGLKDELDSYKTAVDLIYRHTNEDSFPVIFERLQTDVGQVLLENAPTDALSRCQHVFKFHEAQTKIADLINALAKAKESKAILKSPDMNITVTAVFEQLQTCYENIVELRRQLHERPSSRDVFAGITSNFENILKVMQIVRPVSIKFAEITNNNELDETLNECGLSMMDTIEVLRTAPVSIYRPRPTKEQISATIDNVRSARASLADFLKNEEIISNENYKQLIEREIEFLDNKIQVIEGLKPDENGRIFFENVEQLRDRVEKYPIKLRQLPKSADPYIIVNQAMPTFRIVLKGQVPNAEMAKNEIMLAIPPTKELLKYLDKVKHYAIPQESITATNNWIEEIKRGMEMMESRVKGNYDFKQAHRDTTEFVAFLEHISGIPLALRKKLSTEQSDDLAKVLAVSMAAVSNAVFCLRNIPTVGFVNIDMNMFNKIDYDSEISESVEELLEQYKDLLIVMEKVIAMPQLIVRPHTEKLAQNMFSLMTDIASDMKKSRTPEQKLIAALDRQKDRLPRLINNAEFVAPIIGVSKLPEIFKNVHQNTITLHKLLSAKHLDSKTAEAFQKEIIPKIQACAIETESIKLPNTIAKPIIADVTRTLEAIKFTEDRLKHAKPRASQKICDEIYMRCMVVVPQIIDFPEAQVIADHLLSIIDTCTKYTALPVTPVSYTTSISIKKEALTVKAVENVLALVTEYLKSTNSTPSNQILDALEENLGVLSDHNSMLPNFMRPALPFVASTLNKSHQSIIVRGMLLLCLSMSSALGRSKTLEELSIAAFIRTTFILDQVASSIEFIEAGRLDKETSFFLDALKKAVNSTDRKLLSKCLSMSAAALIMNSLHDVDSAFNLLYNSARKAGARGLEPLFEVCFDFQHWLFEADLALINTFYGELDILCISLENGLGLDTNPEILQNASLFVRKVCSHLKGVNRLLQINWEDLTTVSEEFINFQSSQLPLITALHLENDSFKEAIATGEYLSHINPAIRTWTANKRSFSNYQYRIFVESSLAPFLNSISKLQQQSKSKGAFLTTYYFNKSQIDRALNAPIDKSLEDDLKEDFENLHKNLKEFDRHAISNPQKAAAGLNTIRGLIQNVMKKLSSKIAIDFKTNVSLTTSNAGQSLELFADEATRQAAGSVKLIYESALKRAESAADFDSDSVSMAHLERVRNLLVEQKNSDKIEFHSSAHALMETLMTFSLMGKLNALTLALEASFPEVTRRISDETQLTAILQQISSADIMSAISSIMSQIEVCGDPTALQNNFEQMRQQDAIVNILTLRALASKLCHFDVPSEQRAAASMEAANSYAKILSTIKDEKFVDPLVATKAIHSLAQLASELLALSQTLLQNNPKTVKFARSPDGQLVMRQQMTKHDLIENQQVINMQLPMLSSPETLRIVQSKMMPEQVIMQLRVINHMLRHLTQLRDIEVPLEGSIEDLYKEVCSAQLDIINGDTESFTYNMADANLADIVSEYVFDMMDKRLFMDAVNSALAYASIVVPNQKPNKPNDQNMKQTVDFILSIRTDPNSVTMFESFPESKKMSMTEALAWISQEMATQEFLGNRPNRSSKTSDNITSAMRLYMELVNVSDADLAASDMPSSSLPLAKLLMAMNTVDHTSSLATIAAALVAGGYKPDSTKYTADTAEIVKNVMADKFTDMLAVVKRPPNDRAAILASAFGQLAQLPDSMDVLVEASSRLSALDRVVLGSMAAKISTRTFDIAKVEKDYNARKEQIDVLKTMADLLNMLNEFHVNDASSMSPEEEKEARSLLKELSALKPEGQLSRLKKLDDWERSVFSNVVTHLTKALLEGQTNLDEVVIKKGETFSPAAMISAAYNRFGEQSLTGQLIKVEKLLSNTSEGQQASKFLLANPRTFSVQEYSSAKDIVENLLAEPQIAAKKFALLPQETRLTVVALVHDSIPRLLSNEISQIPDIPDLDLNTRRSSTIAPSKYMLAANEAQAASTLLRLLPSMSMMPITECTEILSSESTSMMAILRRLLKHRGVSYPHDAEILLRATPQVAAALVKVMPTLTPEARKLIGVEALEILPMANTIANSAASLDNPKSQKEFHSTVFRLLNAITSISNITSKNRAPPTSEVLSNVVLAVNQNDVEATAEALINLNAINARLTNAKKPDKNIASLVSVIKEITPLIADAHAAQIPLSAENLKKLELAKQKIIESCSKACNNPFEQLAKLKQIADVEKELGNARRDFEIGISDLIRGVTVHDRILVRQSVNDLARITAQAQATAMDGIIKRHSLSSVLDLCTKVGSAMGALRSLRELSTDRSANATYVRRTTRALTRMIDSLEDSIDEEPAAKSAKSVDEARNDYVEAVGNAVRMALGLCAARESAQLPEIFGGIVANQKKSIAAIKEALEKAKEKCLKENADKNVAHRFVDVAESLQKAFEQFEQLVSDSVQSSALTESLGSLSESCIAALGMAQQLTDIPALEPDMESADKIPQSFEMPSVPSDSLAPRQAADALGKASGAAIKAKEEFKKSLAGTNAEICEKTSALCGSIKSTLECTLCALNASTSLIFQNDLSIVATNLVSNTNRLLTALKNRFLLRGDWEQSSFLLQLIEDDIAKAAKVAFASAESAEAEESSKGAIGKKFVDVLRPLQATCGRIDACIAKNEDGAASKAKEWCAQMLAIAAAIAKSTAKYVLNAKEHSSQKADNLLKFTAQLNADAEEICSASEKLGAAEGDALETIVAGAMERLQTTTKSYKPDIDTADGKKFQDAVVAAGRTAGSIAAFAHRAIEQRKAAAERATRAKAAPKGTSSGGTRMRTQTKAWLMERLHYESRVIQARLILERLEKQIKDLN